MLKHNVSEQITSDLRNIDFVFWVFYNVPSHWLIKYKRTWYNIDLRIYTIDTCINRFLLTLNYFLQNSFVLFCGFFDAQRRKWAKLDSTIRKEVSV